MRAAEAAVYCPQTFIDNKNFGHDYKIWFQLDKDICRVQRTPREVRSLLQLLVQYLESFCQKWKVLSAKQKLFSDKNPGCYNLWQENVSLGSQLFVSNCVHFDNISNIPKIQMAIVIISFWDCRLYYVILKWKYVP